MNLLKRNVKTEYIFTVENVPFLYQSERYSLAWGLEHKGFYVDQYGITYQYNLPAQWNFCDKDGTITPKKLFQNLSNSPKHTGLFGMLRKQNPINTMIIDDLQASEIEDSGFIRCDAGNISNVLLVYDTSIELYKRIVLANNGERDLINQSQYTKAIIEALGKI